VEAKVYLGCACCPLDVNAADIEQMQLAGGPGNTVVIGHSRHANVALGPAAVDHELLAWIENLA